MSVGFYYLAVVLAFLSTLPVRTRLGLSVTIAEVVAFPAAICLLLEVMRSPGTRRRFASLYNDNRAVFLYFGWVGVSAMLGSVRSSDTLRIAKDLYPAFVLYLLIGLTIDSPARLRSLCIALLLGLSLHLVFAILQSTAGGPYVLQISDNLEYKTDLSGDVIINPAVGLFAHPNGLGLYLIPYAIFLLAGAKRLRSYSGLVCLLLLVPTLWVMYLVQVKGAYAFMTLGAALMLIPRRFESWRMRANVIAPILAIVAIMWFTVRAFISGEQTYGTLVTRLELWNRALETIRSDFFTDVIGNGYSPFSTTVITFDYPNSHNAWLNHILSFGLLGLALYIACYVGALRRACRALVSATGTPRLWLLAASASLAAMLGENFFEPTDRGDVYPAQLFALIGLATIIPRVFRCATPDPPRSPSVVAEAL